MLISFSTITFDKIGNNHYLGGPADYGGVVLDYLEEKNGIKFLNVCNIARKDISSLVTLAHKNLVPNYIPQSVNFELIFKNDKRQVLLQSKRFKVTDAIFKKFNLQDEIKGNTVIVSPVISEFTLSFFSKLISLKPKALFLDLYNNDDGRFSQNEIKLFETISKAKGVKIFFKLSKNEMRGLTENKVTFETNHCFLTTLGADGAELKNGNLTLRTYGLKVKTINPTGAGDIFIYTFASLYDKGTKLEECLNAANTMAAKSTEYMSLEEFSDGLRQRVSKIL